MEYCLQPQVSCCLINDNHQSEKKDIGEIFKNRKNTFKRTLGLCTTHFRYIYIYMRVCVCRLYLRINVYGSISDI